MKKITCLILSVIICLGLSSTAFAAGTCTNEHLWLVAIGYCNANSVNVRTGPGTNYKSVGLANKGDTYHWYQTVGENPDLWWSHVHGFGTGKHIGWMYADYYTGTEAARSTGVSYERT